MHLAKFLVILVVVYTIKSAESKQQKAKKKLVKYLDDDGFEEEDIDSLIGFDNNNGVKVSPLSMRIKNQGGKVDLKPPNSNEKHVRRLSPDPIDETRSNNNKKKSSTVKEPKNTSTSSENDQDDYEFELDEFDILNDTPVPDNSKDSGKLRTLSGGEKLKMTNGNRYDGGHSRREHHDEDEEDEEDEEEDHVEEDDEEGSFNRREHHNRREHSDHSDELKTVQIIDFDTRHRETKPFKHIDYKLRDLILDIIKKSREYSDHSRTLKAESIKGTKKLLEKIADNSANDDDENPEVSNLLKMLSNNSGYKNLDDQQQRSNSRNSKSKV